MSLPGLARGRGRRGDRRPATLRILFFEPTLAVGGSERLLSSLVTHLDGTLYEPTVCCAYDAGPIGAQIGRAGVRVVDRLMRSRWDVVGLCRAALAMRQEHFDILYTNNHPLTMLWGSLLAWIARIPTRIMVVHQTRQPAARLRRWIANRLFRFDAVIASADLQAGYLVRHEGLPLRRMCVIHNGIDANPFEAPVKDLREEVGLCSGVPVVGIVAVMRPEKAHTVFLQAARIVADEVPNAKFLIVGDGPERERIELEIDSLELRDRVILYGMSNDMPAVMATINVVVLSSDAKVETFPVAIMEAMAASRPVVATRVGSLDELVLDGVTGYLVPPQSPSALAARVVSLLRNPMLARSCGEAGRARILSEFTLDAMVERTEQLFEKLSTEHRGGKRDCGIRTRHPRE